jgi:hypothetical protein
MGTIDTGIPTKWVLVGAGVYNDMNPYKQEIGALHETLHYALGRDDAALARFLDLAGKDESISRDEASARIDRWLNDCFKK